jgi:hypothetical protein
MDNNQPEKEYSTSNCADLLPNKNIRFTVSNADKVHIM